MKRFSTVLSLVILGLLGSPYSAQAKVVAKCKGLMLPDAITDGEISWQVLEDFSLIIESGAEGLTARGGQKENPVNLSGDDVVRIDLTKEQSHAILAQFQMTDAESGLPFNVFGIDPNDVVRGVYYNVGSTSNQQDGSGMGLTAFKNSKNKTVGKLIQAGWLLGMCGK